MIAFEWLGSEILALEAGYVGVAEQAAMVLMVNYEMLIWQIPYGIHLAASVLIGNSAGQNNPKLARRYTFHLAIYTLVVTSVLITVQYNSRFRLANLYTDNEEVKKHFTSNLWTCMLFFLFDST